MLHPNSNQIKDKQMTKRRFSASPQRIMSDLYRLMTDINASSMKINQDIMNGDVEIVFDRTYKRYVFRCDKWEEVHDNLRAIYHTINWLHKAIGEYGVIEDELDVLFDQIFGGFLATPDDTVLLLDNGQSKWWDILGIDKESDKSSIVSAYRALARVHHPDTGGDTEDFKRLRIAYDDALEFIR